jgi:hypothetical protein
MKGKAGLINAISTDAYIPTKGQSKESFDGFRRYFKDNYRGTASAQSIIMKQKTAMDDIIQQAKRRVVDEEFWRCRVKNMEEHLIKMAADYLIQYHDIPEGGFLCYELHKVILNFMTKLLSLHRITENMKQTIKKSELGAKQQMVKGLLVAHSAMKRNGRKEFTLCAFSSWKRSKVLEVARDLAGEITRLRSLNGEAYCNLYAACASSKMLALIWLEGNDDKKAYLALQETLRLYRQAHGDAKNPHEDPAMMDVLAAFGLSTQSNLRADPRPASQEDSMENGSENTLCRFCHANEANIIYAGCSHVCICRSCSEMASASRPDPLRACPICHVVSSRTNSLDPAPVQEHITRGIYRNSRFSMLGTLLSSSVHFFRPWCASCWAACESFLYRYRNPVAGMVLVAPSFYLCVRFFFGRSLAVMLRSFAFWSGPRPVIATSLTCSVGQGTRQVSHSRRMS